MTKLTKSQEKILQKMPTDLLISKLKQAQTIHDVACAFTFDNGDSDGIWTPESLDVLIPDLRLNYLQPADWEIPAFMRNQGMYWLCWDEIRAILAHDQSDTTHVVRRLGAPLRGSVTRIIDALTKEKADKFISLLEKDAKITAEDLIYLLDC